MNAQAKPSGVAFAVMYVLASLRAIAPIPAPPSRTHRVPSVPGWYLSQQGKSQREGSDRHPSQRDFDGCHRASGSGPESPSCNLSSAVACTPSVYPGHQQQRMRQGDGCIVQFDLPVKIEKVSAFQQSETFLLKTNILPHQESNFLSKQFSLNISKQPRVSIDLNCYKREKNEALSLQRSCLPTN